MTKIRSSDGRIVGKLGDYMTEYIEDKWYINKKVKHGELMFPQHKKSLHGEVHTYKLSELEGYKVN